MNSGFFVLLQHTRKNRTEKVKFERRPDREASDLNIPKLLYGKKWQMSSLKLTRSDDVNWQLSLDAKGRYLIGSHEDCAVRLSSGPAVVGRIDAEVRRTKRRGRLCMEDKQVCLRYIPYWEHRRHCIPDTNASTDLDAGDSVERGGPENLNNRISGYAP